jgi:hypothetical protein
MKESQMELCRFEEGDAGTIEATRNCIIWLGASKRRTGFFKIGRSKSKERPGKAELVLDKGLGWKKGETTTSHQPKFRSWRKLTATPSEVRNEPEHIHFSTIQSLLEGLSP